MEIMLPVGIPHDPELNESEFLAVVSLLDDNDEYVVQHVAERLHSYGPRTVPLLRHYRHTNLNLRAQQTLEEVIHTFQQEALAQFEDVVIQAVRRHQDIDLEEAALLLSRFGYPETDDESIRAVLDEIALRVHVFFIQVPQPNDLNLLMCVNRAFFEEGQFHGAEAEYYNPDNSYLHMLIKSRTGIPLSLSILYMLVSERAGVDLYGIGLPAHFVVFHPDLNVFIDAYNHGRFLSEHDCRRFVQDIGFEFNEAMLERVPNVYIIMRMMKNIIHAHSKSDEPWEAAVLQQSLDKITEVISEQ